MDAAGLARRAIAMGLAVAAVACAAAAANPIADENEKPGSDRWDLTPPAHPAIEGYSTEPSAAPGDTFHLHVNAPGGDRYRVLVYRLGWYGGDGGHQVECVPSCDADEPAVPQRAAPPTDPSTGRADAHWSVTDEVHVGEDWVSGYYVAILRVTDGPDTGAFGRVPLIVRGATSDRAAILVQVPVNTWQAYNPWGGKSLYPFNSTGGIAAVKVSFSRPYSEDVPVKAPYALELPTVRFLEREGYDVSYATDVDVDRTPELLLRHRLVMSIGHDEYWTHTMRKAFDAGQRHGTNIAVMGSNAGYWQARYEDGRLTLVEYRSALADPVKQGALRTLQFRALRPPLPECRLFGVAYQYYAQRAMDAPATPYAVAAPVDDPWLAGTGLEAGDRIPGVMGYEWDGLVPGCFPGKVTTLLDAVATGADGKRHHAQAVRTVARSGARVFASGSLELAWGLDSHGGHAPSAGLQELMRNALGDLTRPAAPVRVVARRGRRAVSLRTVLPGKDPRVLRVLIYRVAPGAALDASAPLVCRTASGRCRDSLAPRGRVRYAAVAEDRWRRSAPGWSKPL
ncbi:MAG: N,N-dimethylformamidase beta subunit family domain-containing protein [Gaiellaceae bacterium]